LKKILEKYNQSLKVQNNTNSQFDLWSSKGLAAGTKAKLYEKFFAGVTIRKNYVAFYLMPIYKSNLKELLGLELLHQLKGKYCFHIMKLNPEIE
jgi:hypothetical protein